MGKKIIKIQNLLGHPVVPLSYLLTSMHKRKVEFFAFFQYFQVGEPNFRYSLFSLGKQYLLLSNALQFLKIEEFRDRKKIRE